MPAYSTKMNLFGTLRRFRHTLLPLPVKYGGEFRRLLRFLNEHQHSTREELADFQWQQLRALLDYAYEHVPYYHRSFHALGLHPSDIKTPADFEQLPVLHKEDVAAHNVELRSDEFERFHPIPTTTSATTRDGLTTYRSEYLEEYRRAIVWRHFLNIGYRFRDRRAQLTVPLKFVRDPKDMPIDFNENALLIDSRSVTLENCPRIYARLRKFKPRLLYCQPANAAILIEYFRQQNLSPIHIPVVISVGEKLYPEYRDLIASFFGTHIIQYYGNRENTVSAGELMDGNLYINSEYCYVEFLGPDGHSAGQSPGDIITTSLQNYAFPMIRYHTEDFGVSRGYPDGASRNFEAMEVIGGRGKDLLLTRNGLMAPQIIPVIERACPGKYKRIQLEQTSVDDLVIRVIPRETFDRRHDPSIIAAAYRDCFQNQFKVSVELVEQINRTDSGKYKFVISNPAMNYLRQSNSSRTD